MAKPIVVFRNFENAPPNVMCCVWQMTIKDIFVNDTPPGMFYLKVYSLVLGPPEHRLYSCVF